MNSSSLTQLETNQVPVLIIGGSLVGLATSMFLASHGVQSLAIEKHRGTAIHPRAGYFQLRTMELMRSVGIESQVRKAAFELYDPNGGMNAVETLAGREIANYIPDINQGVDDVSPARRLFMPQQVLEPILKQRAIELGAQFRYSTELTSFAQDEDGVTATVRDVDTGAERQIRSQFMISCDGNRSPVREKLGIAMKGHPSMAHAVTIYFRADCSHALRGRNLGVIYVNNPQVRGFFRLEKTGLGGFLVVSTVGDINEPGARNVADNITAESAAQLIRDAVGEPTLDVKVEDVAKWRAVCVAAERFQQGRIFIAGDAAHTNTPTGGFGGNTGIQDAHNIAWKLAYVTKNLAGRALMDTYNAERQPVGMLVIEQAYNRYVLRSDPDLGTEGMQKAIPDMHVEFNRYRSSAVVMAENDRDDGAADIDPRKSLALPGTRAPHLDLSYRGKKISSLDLFCKGFVLLAGHEGQGWLNAAREASNDITIEAHVVGQVGSQNELKDLPVHREKISSPFSNPFPTAYGIEPSGAVLVRPDGYVAWRKTRFTPDAAQQLSAALNTVLSRGVTVKEKKRT